MKGSGKARRPRRDDLPLVGVSRLRADGTIGRDAASAEIAFGDGEATVRRTVEVMHLRFPNGGDWALFLCPSCGGRARTLRLLETRVVCVKCDGLLQRCQTQDKGPRIQRLRERLFGSSPARHHRRRLEAALKRALIAERRNRLGLDEVTR